MHLQFQFQKALKLKMTQCIEEIYLFGIFDLTKILMCWKHHGKTSLVTFPALFLSLGGLHTHC